MPPQRSSSTRCENKTHTETAGAGRGVSPRWKTYRCLKINSTNLTWSLFDLFWAKKSCCTWIVLVFVTWLPSMSFFPLILVMFVFSVKLELDSVLLRLLPRKDVSCRCVVLDASEIIALSSPMLCDKWYVFLHLFRNLLLFVVPMSSKMNLYPLEN